jgi:hypothetical protein
MQTPYVRNEEQSPREKLTGLLFWGDKFWLAKIQIRLSCMIQNDKYGRNFNTADMAGFGVEKG